MTTKLLWRSIVYGAFAGIGLCMVMQIAGLASLNPAICGAQFVAIIACSIGVAMAIAHGPIRFVRAALGLNLPNSTAGNLGRRMAAGAAVGLFIGPAAIVISGFVVGGVGRAAPCHSAPDFITGALFGAFAAAYMLGIPSLIVGPILGAVVAAASNRWQASTLAVAIGTATVAFLPALAFIVVNWWLSVTPTR